MKKYDVTLSAHYEKTISIYADSPEQAKEKMEIVLFDTDLIDFSDDDFICGKAVIEEDKENDMGESTSDYDDDYEDDCSDCDYCCPMCGACLYEDEM